MDGMGYPNRIKGSAIPLETRILAVVDVFEALTSWRPYHEARDPKTALEMVRTESGTHFDPQVVNVFTTLLRRGHLIGETNMHLLESIKDRYRGGGLFWQNCGLNPNFEASTCLCCVARDTLF
jgi:HD-GYP domain-containing protein (c-di-GMP phosphodiesterase class II)